MDEGSIALACKLDSHRRSLPSFRCTICGVRIVFVLLVTVAMVMLVDGVSSRLRDRLV